MKVMVDVDGCLSEFSEAFTTLAVQLGVEGAKVSRTDQQETWKYGFRVDPVWYEIDSRYNWWLTLKPIVQPGEIQYLNTSIRRHEVFFVTNRRGGRGFHVEEQTRLWLDCIGVDVHRAQVIATGNKGALGKALGIDIALDDKLENLIDLEANGIRAVARWWKYNQEWPTKARSVMDFCERFL